MVKFKYLLFLYLCSSVNCLYAKENAKRIIISSVKTEFNNVNISKRLDKIVLGVFLKDKTYIPIILHSKNRKARLKGYQRFSFKISGRKVYDLTLTIINAETGEIVDSIIRKSIPHAKLYFISRMSIYELLYGKKYIKEKLREIYEETNLEDNIQKKKSTMSMKKIKRLRLLKKRRAKVTASKKRKLKILKSKKIISSKASSKTIENSPKKVVTKAKNKPSEKNANKKNSSKIAKSNLKKNKEITKELKEETVNTNKIVSTEEVKNKEKVKIINNFSNDLGYNRNVERRKAKTLGSNISAEVSTLLEDFQSTDLISTSFSSQAISLGIIYKKYHNEGHNSQHSIKVSRVISSASFNNEDVVTEFEVPLQKDLSSEFYYFNKVLDTYFLAGAHINNIFYFNLDSLNSGIKIGESHIIWLAFGLEKKFNVWNFENTFRLRFLNTFFDDTEYGNREGALSLSGTALSADYLVNIYSQFHLSLSYSTTSIVSKSVDSFTYNSGQLNLGINYLF